MAKVMILSTLFFTTVDCQLADNWMKHQHFSCVQNTKAENVHDSIQRQYLCISSAFWTCISDVNVYAPSSVVSLDYFCGFIDGRNAIRQHTTWDIHMKPNIHIHFLTFSLFNNYWYCDDEYLRVYSNNETSTFCGIRLPWVYDASDTTVKLILVSPRFGTENYQLELQYYGAYAPNCQHFVVFTQAPFMLNTYFPHTEANAFESFHFVSKVRLDVLHIAAMNVCSKDQMVCYDGPGIKSPIVHFTYSNQSDWQCISSTFQMMCKFSRAEKACVKVPHLQYHAMRAKDYHAKYRTYRGTEIYKVRTHGKKWIRTYQSADILQIIERDSRGTTKYVVSYPTSITMGFCVQGMTNSFPYMLYEGTSCMYGGIYIVRTISSKDNEILSVCTPISHAKQAERVINDARNVSIVLIHYSEYSAQGFIVNIRYARPVHDVPFPQTYTNEESVSMTIRTLTHPNNEIYFRSYLFNLRIIQYININLNNTDTLLYMEFYAIYKTSCINITIFYYPYLSNMSTYNVETIKWDKGFNRKELIRSLFINMSSCNLLVVPTWGIWIIQSKEDSNNPYMVNKTFYYLLHTDGLRKSYFYNGRSNKKFPIWYMVHIVRNKDVSPYAIWRVWIKTYEKLSHVLLEIPTDNYKSSSVYEWNKRNNADNVYLTIDKAVNILATFEYATPSYIKYHLFSVWLVRHFMPDDKISKYVAEQTSQHSHFTFHNQR